MLDLAIEDRIDLWHRLIAHLERHAITLPIERVTPELSPETIRQSLAPFDFNRPVAPDKALDFAADGLTRWQVHTPHSRYFGLFNPATTAMGVAADALVAEFNPQLAAWSHSPFAAEVERHLIHAFGQKFGWTLPSIDGTFCSGGAEANHTALLCALTHTFSDFGEHGVRGLPAQPVFYASAEAHHSFAKATRLCGLGRGALRSVAVDDKLRMRPDALAEQIQADRAAGLAPFLVISTAGTTNAAAVDPIEAIAAIAAGEGLWHHTDAAWGGAAALSPALKPLLKGIEKANSITFDAHKWLSVPMGAGIYLTRDTEILSRTFSTVTAYMPKEAAGLDIVDPHLHSMQWSRRAIGMKVFLSLAVAGWKGYTKAIENMTAMGDYLRTKLKAHGWRVLNDTPLPVICFDHPNGPPPQEVVNRVVASGEAWISTTVLGDDQPAIRACITNYRTTRDDIDILVLSLDRARSDG